MKGNDDPSVECEYDSTIIFANSKLTHILKALLEYLRDVKHPTISLYQNTVYSDAGFALLGEVLVRITGKSYNDAIQEVISAPLGIDSFTTHPPVGDEIDAINRSMIDPLSAWPIEITAVAGYVPTLKSPLYLYPLSSSSLLNQTL